MGEVSSSSVSISSPNHHTGSSLLAVKHADLLVGSTTHCVVCLAWRDQNLCSLPLVLNWKVWHFTMKVKAGLLSDDVFCSSVSTVNPIQPDTFIFSALVANYQGFDRLRTHMNRYRNVLKDWSSSIISLKIHISRRICAFSAAFMCCSEPVFYSSLK